ncbi:mucin-2-like [Limanda limanda]|uniref:mucin-2-like n=1 Tax=Limanda limanda TaxID=27771 RepID=UPI0029C61C58|nr:mucin-2-like [Limanda limanda]
MADGAHPSSRPATAEEGQRVKEWRGGMRLLTPGGDMSLASLWEAGVFPPSPSFFICSQGQNKHRQQSARGSDTFFPTGHCTVSESEGEVRGVHGSRITMKTTRVPVLLLLASVHVFTQVSTQTSTEQTTVQSTTKMASVSTTKSVPTIQSEQPVQTTTTSVPKITTVSTETPAPTTVKPTSTAAATTSHKAVTTSVPVVPHMDNQTVGNDTPGTRSFQTSTPSLHSKTGTDVTSLRPALKKETVEPRSSQTPKLSSRPETSETSSHPGHNQHAKTDKAMIEDFQTGDGVKEPLKSADKRLWWILAPVLLVGAAAAIVLKFRSKRINDHSENIDNGTEK